MRKVLIGLGAVIVLLVAAALVVPSFIDWNSYKGDIAAQARAATGRALVIEGDLELDILPSPRLSAEGVRFANIEGGSAPDMASLKSLEVRLRFAPLLKGEVEIDSVHLVEPVILLETLKDGRTNWTFRTEEPASDPASGGPSDAPAGQTGGGAGAIRLDNLEIVDGTLIWRDHRAGSEEKITDLSATLAARSLEGPFNARGSLDYKGIDANVEASIGELRTGAAAPVSLALSLPKTDARAEITGSLVAVGAPPRFSGKIDVGGKDFAGTLAALAGAAAPPALAQPYRLRAKVQASQQAAAVEDLDAELGSVRASGSIKADLGEKPRADAKIRITRIDLDALMPKSASVLPPPGPPAANDAEKANPANAPNGKDAAPPAPFAVPDFNATLDLGIDALSYNDRSIRGIVVAAQLGGGELRLTKASLFLPGGGEASMTGTLAARGGRPAYAAGVSARADNFRALLEWLGVEVAAVPAQRLRRFTVSGQVQGNDRQLQILNTTAELDTTRVEGAATIALRSRPAFGATLSVDRINLDAYMPAPGTAPAPSSSKPAGPASSGGKPADGAPAGDSGGPLAALDAFDANVKFRVGQMTYQRQQVRDLRFDGTVAGGTLTIRNASVEDLAGVKASVSGTLSERAGLPVFKGKVAADAQDITGALRLAGVTPPPTAKSLGALRLRGEADASADKADVDLTLNAAGATVKLAGTASGFDKAPTYNATLTASHGDFAQLLRTLGNDVSGSRLGSFAMTAKATGGLNALSANVEVKAAGGTVAAKGTGSSMATTPVFDVVLDADHPAVGTLIRSFAPDYRPQGGAIGPFSLQAALKGAEGTFEVSRLDVRAGDIVASGKGDLKTAGARPALVATLDAGTLDLNPFLPAGTDRSAGGSSSSGSSTPPVPGPGGGGKSSGSPFSDEKFNTAALGLMDADLKVGAKALLYRQFRVDDPSIQAKLDDRLLTISQIAGRMFDGSFDLSGKLDGRAVPKIDGKVAVSKANVGKALFQAAEFDLQGGITDFDLNVTGAGATPQTMVASLAGGGNLASRDGTVKGFDLKAVSDRLKDLDKAVDFLSLFGAAMEGGSTKFSTLDGTFAIEKGVLRTDDIKLVAEAGQATAAGFANLPQWHMDFSGQFALTEHPKAPPFKMRAVGPIDDPKRVFDFKQLQGYLLQRGIGTILRKALPDKFGGGSQDGAKTDADQKQPATKPRPEDMIRGILDQFRR